MLQSAFDTRLITHFPEQGIHRLITSARWFYQTPWRSCGDDLYQESITIRVKPSDGRMLVLGVYKGSKQGQQLG